MGATIPAADFETSFLGLLPSIDRMSFDPGDLLSWTGDRSMRFQAR